MYGILNTKPHDFQRYQLLLFLEMKESSSFHFILLFLAAMKSIPEMLTNTVLFVLHTHKHTYTHLQTQTNNFFNIDQRDFWNNNNLSLLDGKIHRLYGQMGEQTWLDYGVSIEPGN